MKLKKYKNNAFTLSIDTLPKESYNKRKRIWEENWYDKDEILLHANFQILRDFIEKEDAQSISWECKATKRAWKEINRLYNWYTKERPQRVNIWNFFYEKCKDTAWGSIPCDLKNCISIKQGEIEERWYEEDDKNLIALMKIRKFLWT